MKIRIITISSLLTLLFHTTAACPIIEDDETAEQDSAIEFVGAINLPVGFNAEDYDEEIIKKLMLYRKRAEYPGGTDSLRAFITRNTSFPRNAQNKGVQGAYW